MRLAMLQVHHPNQAAARQKKNRAKCFGGVFGEVVELVEARILEGLAKNYPRLAVLGHPSSNALAHAQLQPVEQFLVRIFGSSQDQIIPCEHIDKTGVTFDHFYCEIQNTIKRLVKAISSGDTADGVV